MQVPIIQYLSFTIKKNFDLHAFTNFLTQFSLISTFTDWTKKDEDEKDVNVWEDNWDDDNVEDDFNQQLRQVLYIHEMNGSELQGIYYLTPSNQILSKIQVSVGDLSFRPYFHKSSFEIL